MTVNLKGKDFLSLKDFSNEELNYLIDLAADLKKKKKTGIKGDLLNGKNIALIFEKTSTRTRSAFVVAARDEGAMPEFLGKNDIQLGKKESVADTARVLARMFDGIEFRGYSHETVETLAKYSDVPVWNGLTDMYHPTQVLADFLTIKENFGKLENIKFLYTGDGRNNMANSLIIGAAKAGMDCRILSPKELWPEKGIVGLAKEINKTNGGSLTITDKLEEAIVDVDVIYTDVWVSMGEEDLFEQRINLLKDYQVNMNMINKAANKDLIFLHCLPAFHNLETETAKKVYKDFGISEMEVTDEVFESKYSKVFEQAENRMHTIKAVMVATL
ncbi:ornithine carbamoyltransferase [Natronospora cellulosivora (SeqCode)]